MPLLALTAGEQTVWQVTVGLGAVVVLVVITLLTFLLRLVRDIDEGVGDVLGVAGGVSANTGNIVKLATTASAVEAIKREAVLHLGLLRKA
jgi:hypothetical protein